jgi:Ca2+/H+ antiporter
MSPEQQQRAIKIRSCWMMGLGTCLVLLFSDPMVDVLDDIGRRINVNAFYVSFVLAPLVREGYLCR